MSVLIWEKLVETWPKWFAAGISLTSGGLNTEPHVQKIYLRLQQGMWRSSTGVFADRQVSFTLVNLNAGVIFFTYVDILCCCVKPVTPSKIEQLCLLCWWQFQQSILSVKCSPKPSSSVSEVSKLTCCFQSEGFCFVFSFHPIVGSQGCLVPDC